MKFNYKKCYKDKVVTAIRKYNHIFEKVLKTKSSKWTGGNCEFLNRAGFHELSYYPVQDIYINDIQITNVHLKMSNQNKNAYISVLGTNKISPDDFYFDVHFKNGKVDKHHYDYVKCEKFKKDYKILCDRIEKNISNSIINIQKKLSFHYS